MQIRAKQMKKNFIIVYYFDVYKRYGIFGLIP